MFDEGFKGFAPVGFFQFEIDCLYLKEMGKDPLAFEMSTNYLLPDLSFLCQESPFAKVFMGWHEGGVLIQVEMDQPFLQSTYPAIEKGDAIELFFDTRDIKTSAYNTRFCHHFFFLAEAIEGRDRGEKTYFRTEDRHEWCNPSLLLLKNSSTKKGGSLVKVFIPSEALQGYDAEQFDRFGFTYRLDRAGGATQHLSTVTQDFAIEQHPSLWSSVRMIRKSAI